MWATKIQLVKRLFLHAFYKHRDIGINKIIYMSDTIKKEKKHTFFALKYSLWIFINKQKPTLIYKLKT